MTILYKYKPLSDRTQMGSTKKKCDKNYLYCMDILRNHRLFLPKVDQLNDQNEGYVQPVVISVAGVGTYSALGRTHPIIEAKINQYRILSLTKNPDNSVMWAHYANNYCGICYMFSGEGVSFRSEKTVKYESEPFETIYDPEPEELDRIIENNLTHKSIIWSYEEEHRIITKQNNCYLHFERKELLGIIIGFRACERGNKVNKIIEYARMMNIPVYYAMVAPRTFSVIIIKKNPMEIVLGRDNLDSLTIELP